ncbi:hypothetical protein BOX15_Mlig026459g1 [Macrostomum lignano]|uniref:Uncharacterized protein n=1 Tax=Macrostomum lignano TaxID=282301 RepID=A0A267F9D6_9PLAT|nr:hypothetical protein BOX15_Mlig026459g1 [Macrostomum lignano]
MGVFEKICTAVTDYMDQLADVNFGKYPPFRDYMKERLTKKTTTIKTDARKWLENVLKMEATCVQTRNRQFNRVGQTPPAPRESFSSEDLPDHEEDGEHSAADDIPQSFRQSMDENELLIYVLLTKYLLILADQTVDNVAKTIQYQLSYKLAEEMDSIHALLPESDTLHGLMKNPEKRIIYAKSDNNSSFGAIWMTN